MKIIIPMAGMGKRMRPQTLTVPKPLIQISGKTIVQLLIEEINKVLRHPITDIGFVIGDFGKSVENELVGIARKLGAEGHIFYQNEPLGTAHAVFCAAPLLQNEVIVVFADTLFKVSHIEIDKKTEGLIWVKSVEDPRIYGVVKVNENNHITEFIEHPQDNSSNLAIIGMYYFRNAENLKSEIQYLLDNQIVVKGEYQLTVALENMKRNGTIFSSASVLEWLDCGNKETTLYAHQRILEHRKNEQLVDYTAVIKNSIVVPPCFIGENVLIENSVIGKYTSVGQGTKIRNSIVLNSIIQQNSLIENVNVKNSIIGNFVKLTSEGNEWNIGDYSQMKI